MLTDIPEVLSPELLKVPADGNFPAASKAARLRHGAGRAVPELLAAILRRLPLDTFVARPAHSWPWCRATTTDPTSGRCSADAIVATRDRARYAKVILKQGSR